MQPSTPFREIHSNNHEYGDYCVGEGLPSTPFREILVDDDAVLNPGWWESFYSL